MKRRIYQLEPREGFSIIGFKGVRFTQPTHQPLEIIEPYAASNIPIEVRVQSIERAITLFQGFTRDLLDVEDLTHRVSFTVYNEAATIDNERSHLHIHPNGGITYNAERFIIDQGIGFAPSTLKTEYHLNLTNHPKREGKTGLPIDFLLNVIKALFPEPLPADNELALEDFDLRIGLAGRYSCDIQFYYEEHDDEQYGKLDIYTPFTRSKREAKRNRTREEMLFSLFTRRLFSLKEIPRKKHTKEEKRHRKE